MKDYPGKCVAGRPTVGIRSLGLVGTFIQWIFCVLNGIQTVNTISSTVLKHLLKWVISVLSHMCSEFSYILQYIK